MTGNKVNRQIFGVEAEKACLGINTQMFGTNAAGFDAIMFTLEVRLRLKDFKVRSLTSGDQSPKRQINARYPVRWMYSAIRAALSCSRVLM